jgi:hypothetical protein
MRFSATWPVALLALASCGDRPPPLAPAFDLIAAQPSVVQTTHDPLAPQLAVADLLTRVLPELTPGAARSAFEDKLV